MKIDELEAALNEFSGANFDAESSAQMAEQNGIEAINTVASTTDKNKRSEAIAHFKHSVMGTREAAARAKAAAWKLKSQLEKIKHALALTNAIRALSE